MDKSFSTYDGNEKQIHNVCQKHQERPRHKRETDIIKEEQDVKM